MDKQRKKLYHLIFRITLFLKGLEGLIEAAFGFVLYFTSMGTLSRDIVHFFAHELAHDSTDFLANFIIGIVHNFSASIKTFVALYLIIDGLIKLGLVVGLWLKKPWAYPAAIILLCFFVLFQLYKLAFHFSYYLLFITITNIMIILLLGNEYRKAKLKKAS
jgi:uncharacterized membrane protein